MEMLLDDFFWRALLAGAAIAIIGGPLGCFIVWRRMAYFGDTMAHSALLGVALGLLLDLAPMFAVAIVAVAIALLLVILQRNPRLSSDTLLGILSHAALSIGLVAISFLTFVRVDLLSYLFGDILAVSQSDLLSIVLGGALILAVLMRIWRPLLALTVSQELAQAEGVPVARTRLTFMLLIALVIALAMKVVGVLLITSLLIIPPATARRFALSPESMAILASLIGVASVVGGLSASLAWDTPSGPSIVVAATFLFILSTLRAPAQSI
ncbi:zinc ABC transporter permease subunit ZnuB [Magnetofaba australis]|uniref:High-affinity zinc uptake system membrane protein ZnuB n=1 Tax=Magnetofaba australis IT-1 TaxID=1434232 RepID=A0A1Y2K1A7_9PROT|nr:zinc ABC transporter permease subunit ZnuB [Magnetofaba australis]OSM01729.1 putative zinc ABC transporter permease [Magnetofaba australis IT-1]